MHIHASADHFSTVRSHAVDLDVEVDSVLVNLILEPVPSLRVVGRVTSREGLPLANGFVQLNAYGGDYPAVALAEWNRASRFGVAPDGSYEATLPIAMGRFRLRAMIPGHADTRTDWIVVPSETSEEVRVDIEVAAGSTLSGGVRDRETGEPIAGAGLRLSTVLTGEHMYFWRSIEGVTDANGRFEIPHIPDGEVSIIVIAPGYAEEYALLDVPTQLTAEISVPRIGSLEGIATWDDGRPLPGAVVGLHPGEKAVMRRLPKTSTRTGPDGRFHFPDLYPGLYELDIEAAREDEQTFTPRRSGPYRTGEPVTLVVQHAGQITGTVVDAAGESVEGVVVTVRGDGVTRSASTSVVGRFQIGGLPPGTYDVRVNPTGAGGGRDHGTAPVVRADAGTTGMQLTLPAGLSIEGVVRDTSGQGLAGLWIAVGERRVMTAGTGAFIVRGLATGEHAITITDPPLGPRRHSVTTLDGATAIPAGATDVVLTAR